VQGAAGRASSRLRSRPGFLLATASYFGVALALWRPLPAKRSRTHRLIGIVTGALFYFPGLGLIMWARRALGAMYNFATTAGAPLYRDPYLVTSGPYAFVRHPLYAGLLATALGGLLLYWRWTFLFGLLTFLPLPLRARREEEALAATFGDAWQQYCSQVPGWFPRRARKLTSGWDW
jgi:protein-S-isoprenylcysteine O-methyltransferase Ste14